jgi:hypothetical protein
LAVGQQSDIDRFATRRLAFHSAWSSRRFEPAVVLAEPVVQIATFASPAIDQERGCREDEDHGKGDHDPSPGIHADPLGRRPLYPQRGLWKREFATRVVATRPVLRKTLTARLLVSECAARSEGVAFAHARELASLRAAVGWASPVTPNTHVIPGDDRRNLKGKNGSVVPTHNTQAETEQSGKEWTRAHGDGEGFTQKDEADSRGLGRPFSGEKKGNECSMKGTAMGDGYRDKASQMTEAAGEQSREVAQSAKDEASQVADKAKDEARHVKDEVTAQARGLVDQAKTELRDQSHAQADQAARAIRRVGDQATALAEGRVDEAGAVADYVRQAGERVKEVGDRLEHRGVDGVLNDVQGFARRRPGAFLAGCAAAGFVAGRLIRGGKAASDSSNGASDGSRGSSTPQSGPYTRPVV